MYQQEKEKLPEREQERLMLHPEEQPLLGLRVLRAKPGSRTSVQGRLRRPLQSPRPSPILRPRLCCGEFTGTSFRGTRS